ncbi:hypothetical protein [Bathymodiolus platifrons methanotrophic gill symbiont]|uniref:hypothetical protein n=1 Tax=Bathymodiolus platifrons methanotrophic gill symbiont TaxID=113268 RepID=UPI001124E019|nr:hypothetical protein [Bathymodiolus platifrons methanotrophic gill symbiont]
MCSVCGGRRAAGASPVRCVGGDKKRHSETVAQSLHFRECYDGSGEVAHTQGVLGAEGINGRLNFLPDRTSCSMFIGYF